MDESLFQLLKTSLLKGSQMAYLEGANDTASALYHLNRLLNYWMSRREILPLKDEITALRDYAEMLRLGDDRRIELEIAPELMNFFIHRLDILSFLAEQFPPNMLPDWVGAACRLCLLKKDAINLEITLQIETRLHRHSVTKTISEARIDMDAQDSDC